MSDHVISATWKYLTPLYLGWRIWWANRMPIMDCDEVYNYWEPLHFLLFGSGFQTWEYANEFALRTYAYLMPLLGLSHVYQALIPYLPGWIWPLLTTTQNVVSSGLLPPKLALFLLLRATLATAMAYAEVSFCQAMEDPFVGLTTAGLLLGSAGMSHAAGALLPSSTLTMLWLLSATAFLQRRHIWCSIWAILATLAIGWPFGVLMFVPLGVTVLVRERIRPSFVLNIAILAVVIQAGVTLVDKHYYGKWVSPVWNILIYNAQAGGDELYGIEPPSYYVKNLFLNMNYVVAVGIMSFVLIFKRDHPSLLVLLAPMYIWLGVVVPRPHKEERFLFPVYPCLCLGAAMLSVTAVELTLRCCSKAPVKSRFMLLLLAVIWTPATLLSLSRTVALSKYYTAPLSVYSQLQHHPDVADSTICTCGEWYRFPSSFYLPSNIQSFGFVQSSFQGQLPQPFLPTGSKVNNVLHFNDQNRPEPASYTSIDHCDYLIDLFNSDDCRENDSIWKPLAMGSFLLPTTSTLHRTLYIPGLHERDETRGLVEYVDYILYQKMQ